MRAQELLPLLIRAAREGPDAVLAAVAPHLRALGFVPDETPEAPRAVAWRRGRARLALSGHVDVVPVGEGWTRDAFGGEVDEGRVWGRGACDMLGAVACFVEAAARVPDAPCSIVLTTDEETRMAAAERALADGLFEGIDRVVVGEPTEFRVGVAEKGVLWLRVRTTGRNAHGSMPHLGENAAMRLVRVLSELDSLAWSGRHPLLGPATANLGTLRAGDAVNQVPAVADAELDIRYLPGMSRAAIEADVRAMAAKVGVEVDVQVASHHEPFETPADSPFVHACVAAVHAARPQVAPSVVGLPYGTEASKFAPAGLSCIILGPGEPGLAHTNQESITLDALDAGATMYAALLSAERDA